MKGTDFFVKLDSLTSRERVTLKRSAGIMLAEADGRAVAAFLNCLPNTVEEQEEECWFASACFHCLWEADCSPRVAMEEACHELIYSNGFEEVMRKRIEALLDDSWEDPERLLMHLHHILRALKQNGYCIDCLLLLNDLLDWSSGNQTVRLKWSRRIFQKRAGEEQEND